MSEQLTAFVDNGLRPFATAAIEMIERLEDLVGSYYVPGSPETEVEAADPAAVIPGTDSGRRPALTYGGLSLSMVNCAAVLQQFKSVPEGGAISFLDALRSISPKYSN